MSKIYVGVDNGVTGSIGIIFPEGKQPVMYQTPTFTEQNYTKTKANISRLDVNKFQEILETELSEYLNNPEHTIEMIVERPMVNPARLTASISAVRCLEATLIAISKYSNISFRYCDSKEWQKIVLPSGVKGSNELKKVSKDIGIRLFKNCQDVINKQKDADSLLIAYWFRVIDK